MPTDLSRRDVVRLGLVASAGAALAACTTSPGSGTPTQTDPGGPEDPDRDLRAAVAADEARLTALYAAAAKVLSGTPASRVATVGQRHEAYRRPSRPRTPPRAARRPAAPSGASGPAASAPALTAAGAVRALVAAETAAASTRARQTASATDSELARIIALAGTGAAAAAVVLSAGRAS